MRLDENVRTDNNIETRRGRFGVCMAMTIQWILASKRYNGVTHTGQIGKPFAFLIAQAAGMIVPFDQQDDRIIRNAGLVVVSQTDYPTLTGIGTLGYNLLTIWNAARNIGHAMGTWITGSTYQFFDPNFGLYRADNSTDLINSARVHCNYHYYDLDAAYVLRKIAP